MKKWVRRHWHYIFGNNQILHKYFLPKPPKTKFEYFLLKVQEEVDFWLSI